MKSIFIIVFSIFTFANVVLSQDNSTMAQDAYLKAEAYVLQSDSKNALKQLANAEKYLGATNSKILYLKISILKSQFNTNSANYTMLKSAIDEFFSLTSKDNYPSEKYLEMVRVKSDLNDFCKPAPAGITAIQVIENYLTAIGGRTNLAMITDLTTSLSMVIPGISTSVSLKYYQKAPDKTLTETFLNGVSGSKQIYDGKRGVVTAGTYSSELTGDVLESTKYNSILYPELDYEKYGINTELRGIANINGKEVYLMAILYPNGKMYAEYYEVATGFKVRKESGEGIFDIQDYRNVKGYKFPFQLSTEADGQTIILTVESIQINTNLNDDFFKI